MSRVALPLPVPVLVLGGDPYDMGYAHGSLLKENIGVFIEEFLKRSEHVFGVPYSVIERHSSEQLPYIPESYVQEMRGIAVGAEVPFEEILALNTFPDTDALYEGRVIHCANFAVLPEITTDGCLYHGRNFDFPHERRHWNKACLIYRRAGHGRAAATAVIGFSGQIGLVTGMSSSQIVVSEVTAYPKQFSTEGWPIMIALRAALEEGHTAEAVAVALEHRQFMGAFNILISDGKDNSALSVEVNSSAKGRVIPQNGMLVLSGMCQDTELKRGQRVPVSDVVRHLRNQMLILEGNGRHNADTIRAILADQFDLLKNKIGHSQRSICNAHTVHSLVAIPSTGEFLVSLGPPPSALHPFTRTSLLAIENLPNGLHYLESTAVGEHALK